MKDKNLYKCACMFAYFFVAMLVKKQMKLITCSEFYVIVDVKLSLEIIFNVQPISFVFFLLTRDMSFHEKCCVNILDRQLYYCRH